MMKRITSVSGTSAVIIEAVHPAEAITARVRRGPLIKAAHRSAAHFRPDAGAHLGQAASEDLDVSVNDRIRTR
ncbi:hypothetical protein X777_03945 [Ooceraea biroi]|uniref:Uncharacterized protein n=1 Tax=Ooceraea biroi TaxID=2015173 RepID=A0A026WJC2_OOCBI|nr:hypothetical protein X777_03945 [Ooceraea biroi]